MQPIQQQGRRIPPPSLESAFLIRTLRVSAFLPEITQQIHSLRASGVMSSHAAHAAGAEAMALRKSSGIVCTTPPTIVLIAMSLFYQISGRAWDSLGAALLLRDKVKIMEHVMHVDCVISGGGPAGIMLGFLLARQGVSVAVCEKWPDFFRDFRGDTIHPSTMEVLQELGLLEKFLTLPHNETKIIEGDIGDEKIVFADFSHLAVRCPFIAFMPQWDFLNFIAGHAHKLPGFCLSMETEVTDIIYEGGAVAGLRTKKANGDVLDIRAKLVIGADGRHSAVREKAGIPVLSSGAPMDVLWFRLSKKAADPDVSLGRVDRGRMMIMINRDSYWQCGFLITKGGYEEFKRAGLDFFRKTLADLQPFLADRTAEITSPEQLKLLSVTVDHVAAWYKPGLLLIGDAAHAMSPIGGVGINLAIQDAVAAANILGPRLKDGSLSVRDLARVQKRRALPARMVQRVQVFIQNRVIRRVLASHAKTRPPRILRLMQLFPILRRIPAYIIGMGIRHEHVQNLS